MKMLNLSEKELKLLIKNYKDSLDVLDEEVFPTATKFLKNRLKELESYL